MDFYCCFCPVRQALFMDVAETSKNKIATFAVYPLSNAAMNEDEIIVERIIQGDQNAFRELIQMHEKLVYHMISRLVDKKEDREDLCQEVFLKVFRKLPGFRFQSRLSTWIATIAYRMALNHLKKTKKWQISELDYASYKLKDNSSQADVNMNRNDLCQQVHQMIRQLPEQYRIVLTLYHLEDMPYAEIALVCDMPEGTVKSYIFRARKLLKEKLEKIFKKEELL